MIKIKLGVTPKQNFSKNGNLFSLQLSPERIRKLTKGLFIVYMKRQTDDFFPPLWSETFFATKSSENDEKCFFHLKSSFRSRGIYIFFLTFWKSRLNKKIRLILQFMTSQPG